MEDVMQERCALEREARNLGLVSISSGFNSQAEGEREAQVGPTASYDAKLDEALSRLNPKYFRAPHALATATRPKGLFDVEYWRVKPDIKAHPNAFGGGRYKMLVLRRGKKPAAAIEAIVDRSSTHWSMDCAYFVQIAHLYALSQTDPAGFDRTWRNKEFRLRYHESSGAGAGYIKYFFRRTAKTDPWTARYGKDWKWHIVSSKWNEATILAATRRGGRVMWTNKRAPENADFRNENTVKMGDDQYRAFGFGTTSVLTGRQIALLLAAVERGESDATLRLIIADPSNARAALRSYTDDHVFLKEALSFRRP
jgi:hypothetical protein